MLPTLRRRKCIELVLEKLKESGGGARPRLYWLGSTWSGRAEERCWSEMGDEMNARSMARSPYNEEAKQEAEDAWAADHGTPVQQTLNHIKLDLCCLLSVYSVLVCPCYFRPLLALAIRATSHSLLAHAVDAL